MSKIAWGMFISVSFTIFFAQGSDRVNRAMPRAWPEHLKKEWPKYTKAAVLAAGGGPECSHFSWWHT
jgi:hypothetical protein